MKPQESFVGQPIRSLQTMLRVIAQSHPQVPSPIPDGIFGGKTAQAVAAFQRNFGLSATGVVDLATWNRVVEVYRRAQVESAPAQPIQITLQPGQVILPGQSHPAVLFAQCLLDTIGQFVSDFPDLELTGVLDPSTQRALAFFQLSAGLSPTGHLDKITWRHLSLQASLAFDRLSLQWEQDHPQGV